MGRRCATHDCQRSAVNDDATTVADVEASIPLALDGFNLSPAGIALIKTVPAGRVAAHANPRITVTFFASNPCHGFTLTYGKKTRKVTGSVNPSLEL